MAEDKVKKAMKELSENKRTTSNGNRMNPSDTKIRSDAQHGQTDVNKAKRMSPPRRRG